MAKPSSKHVHVLMYGKRLIAAFQHESKANLALENLKLVVPTSYPIKPKLVKVSIQG